ncbi:aminotransferase class-V family protein, partial [Vibrio parahaemolyticus V-223/04]
FYLQANGKLPQKRLMFTFAQMKPSMASKSMIFRSPTNQLLLICLRQFFLVKSTCRNTV